MLNTYNYYYTDANNVYDPTGHLRREVDGALSTHAFFYNDLYELVSESHPDFGVRSYGFDKNGNRISRTDGTGTDYYLVDANNKLLWVNRNVNAPPTSGQANPYTLFNYDLNGRMTYRDRRHDGGLRRIHDFIWDGDDRLREVKEGGAVTSVNFGAFFPGTPAA